MKYYHYCELINLVDKNLSLLHASLKEASWIAKDRWLTLIDNALDHRLILMELRDNV